MAVGTAIGMLDNNQLAFAFSSTASDHGTSGP
jgi:hypothetical protein